jgi:hypothetical protein
VAVAPVHTLRRGMAKQAIITVRVSNAEWATLKTAAGSEQVSTWLLRLGLEEAKRRAAAKSANDLLSEARSEGFGLSDAAAATLAEQAIHAVRRRAR